MFKSIEYLDLSQSTLTICLMLKRPDFFDGHFSFRLHVPSRAIVRNWYLYMYPVHILPATPPTSPLLLAESHNYLFIPLTKPCRKLLLRCTSIQSIEVQRQRLGHGLSQEVVCLPFSLCLSPNT